MDNKTCTACAWLSVIFGVIAVALGFYVYQHNVNYQCVRQVPVAVSAVSSPSAQKAAPALAVTELQSTPEEGHRLFVNGKPYIVRGACFHPIPIGKDYQYNFWGLNPSSLDQDLKLIKDMGANTIRLYRPGKNADEVNRHLSYWHEKYGFYVLMGTYLGFWDWPPPNYADDTFREKIKEETLDMVRAYKDNPAVLMWVLGNENNYSFDRNIQRWSTDEIDKFADPEKQRLAKAEIYYAYVNELAAEIKKIDPTRPVVMGVGETASLDVASRITPNIDVIGMIAYRGPTFGNLFRQIKQKYDKPVMMIEWGADSYNSKTGKEDQATQAEFMANQWRDISRNLGGNKGEKNMIGGTFFEWSDEWWKGNENLRHTWTIHETTGNWGSAAYYHDFDGADSTNMNEEWWGVLSLDRDEDAPAETPDTKVAKKSYEALKKLWLGELQA